MRSPSGLAALLVFAGLAGCVTKTPPVKLATPTPVAVAYVLDASTSRAVLPIPDSLRRRVADVLYERALVPREVDALAEPVTFAAVRDTPRRLVEVASRASGAKLVVLVELEAAYFSQISGRYKWTVYAKLSVADPRSLQTALTTQLELPAVLELAHEGEAEAVARVASVVAERLATLLDDWLRGARELDKALGASGLIYFILVDRFHNGEPHNDVAVDTSDPSGWHGGDIQGVIDKLDYLYDLGVRTVWLSPVSLSRTEKFAGHGAFHGYWVWDLAAVDARFGGAPALAALSQALHARGMKLLLDVVVNHVGFGAPLVAAHPEWFHGEGGIEHWQDPRELETHDVHGLPDLAQERDDVFAFLVEASAAVIAAVRPDGLRLDAVKHVPLAFWRRYNDALRARFGERFVSLGEAFDGRPELLAATLREGGFTHLFDFPVAFALTDVACKREPVAQLAATLWSDREYDDAAARLVTFVDNHDLPRLASLCTPPRARLALSLLHLVRGTPALTYGSEAGLSGRGEPENRADMRFPPAGDAALFAHVAELARLRRSHPALAHGATAFLALERDVLVFLRHGAEERLVVFLNAGDEATTAPAVGQGCRGRDLASGEELALDGVALAGTSARVVALFPGCADGQLLGERTRPREVRIAARADQRELLVVGSGAELGRWQPGDGLPLAASDGARVAMLSLPVGGVYAYKLVRRDGAAYAFEAGNNRYLFVSPGDAPLDIDVEFREAL